MIDGLFKKYIDPLWEMPARPLARVLTGSGHWIGHRVGRRIGVPRALALAAAPRHLGVVLVAHAPAGVGPQEQCELGRGLLRAWLVAAREGWAVHPLSQLIDVPTTAARVRALLPDGHEAVAIFRLGHPPTPAPHSPRRPLTRPKAALSAWLMTLELFSGLSSVFVLVTGLGWVELTYPAAGYGGARGVHPPIRWPLGRHEGPDR